MGAKIMSSKSPLATRLAAGAAVGAIAIAAGPALAQVGMTGYSLSGGFAPAPQVLDLTARGADPASDHVRGCPGYANLEDRGFRLTFRDGYLPLRFYLDSTVSPGLLLRGPDGISRCAAVDDQGIARVVMGSTLDGDYEIWPLSAAPDEPVDTRVLVSEYELSDWEIRPPVPPNPDDFDPPVFGTVEIDPSMDDGVQTLASGTYTGSISAWDLSPHCPGHIDEAGAHVAVDLTAPADELSLNIEAVADGTMMVLTPDGEWLCNDDYYGLHPAVTVSPAPEGRYYVLGGTFGQDVTTEATFYANLGLPVWSDGHEGDGFGGDFGDDFHDDSGDGLAFGAEPAFDWIFLPDEGEDPVTSAMTLSGRSAASDFQAGCRGQINPERPDFVVVLPEDGVPVAMRARSDADTTLVVVDPSGLIHCDDDTYGLDPEIHFPTGQMGEYDVWVGSWGSGDNRPATLTVSREPGASEGDFDDSIFDESIADSTLPPVSASLGLDEAPAFDRIALAEDGAAPVTADMTLTGDSAASDIQSGCWGQINLDRPDFVVDHGLDASPVTMRVHSDADTTLLVVDPAGVIHCDDDTYGLDPEIHIPSGSAGDYQIWVGSWGAGSGRPATLTVSQEREGSDVGQADPFATEIDDIFAGVETMADVWDAMVADMAVFGTDVTVDSISADGPESLELGGITINDQDFSEPVSIASARVNAFDVAGLREIGEPSYFDVEIVDIDYMPVAELAASDAGMPIGDMETALASVALRFMPGDGMTDIGLTLELSDAISVTLDAIVSGEQQGIEALQYAPIESFELSIVDSGFIAELIDTQAPMFGMSGDDLLALYDEGMLEAPFPITDEDPRGAVFVALRALIAERDTGGTFALSFTPDQPMTMDEVGMIMEGAVPIGDGLGLRASYTSNASAD